MTETIPFPYEESMAVEWISTHADSWSKGIEAVYAVCDKTTGNLLGCVGLTILSSHHRASLGYWFGVDYWGKGYCTEASKAVVSFAFSQLKINRIEAFHLTHNPASGAVMRKIGMLHEGTHRDYTLKNAKFCDMERYAILASDVA